MITKLIHTFEDQLDKLKLLATNYPESPEPTFFNWYSGEAQFGAGHRGKVGSAFGRDGWTRKLNPYGRDTFDWVKTVGGVQIRIERAENIPEISEGTPVDPLMFDLEEKENAA